MDGVKVALGNKGMTVEATCQCAKERRALVYVYLNEFHVAILLSPVFFRKTLPCSGGYHLERDNMIPLHDAVGINCKNGATILRINAQMSV